LAATRGRPEECRMPASMTRGMGKIGHRLSAELRAEAIPLWRFSLLTTALHP